MAYVCKAVSCNKKWASGGAYFRHSQVHALHVACPEEDCESIFTSKNALQVHLSRDHGGDDQCSQDLEPVNFNCPVDTCRTRIASRKEFLDHMPDHIALGQSFKCRYPVGYKKYPCNYRPNNLNQFRVHVTREHTPRKIIPSEAPSRSLQQRSEEFLSAKLRTNNTSSSNLHPPPPPQFNESTSNPEANPSRAVAPEVDWDSEKKIKHEFAKFYLRMESEFVLPSSTVQVIAEQIRRTTELSHHCLKSKLRAKLESFAFDQGEINSIISIVFSSDTVFNIHHRDKDIDQLSTGYFRELFWKKHYPFVEPIEFFLGRDANGKKKCAHLFPLRESLTVMLKDPAVKEMVLQSFKIQPQDEENLSSSKIFSDFTDGTAYAEHMKQHQGKKCLCLLMFQDGFDFGAFGPSQGVYKPLGFYYALGNIKPEYRTKLGCIQMLYLVLEKYFKTTLQEDLDAVDKIKEVLQPVLDELQDLKENGIEFDGEIIPVCLMFGLGDNAGQHFIGRFVQCFTATHCCRFCPISFKDIKANPAKVEPYRTPREYEEAVLIAKQKFDDAKEKALEFAKKQEEKRIASGSSTGNSNQEPASISKSARKKLTGTHHLGVKYIPSCLNSDGFHVSNFSLCVCIGHDLFEGILKSTIPAILKHLSVEEKWFDLDLLNDRIKKFICEGNDKGDAPTPLKSFDSLGGNASENWTLLRVLPFMIEDLIQDRENEMWCLYLQLKEIVEMITAPKISLQQVLYLKILIREFLDDLTNLLPDCVVLKAHLLIHYPDFIMKWGPLIRLFTLRFESKHVFFKRVAKACHNYVNITYTLSNKYARKFALDHSDGLLPPDVSYDKSIKACNVGWSQEQKAVIDTISNLDKIEVTDKAEVFGVTYRTGELLQLGLHRICDLEVGIIDKILVDSHNNVAFLLDIMTATNSFNGYYQVHRSPAKKYELIVYEDLVDNYPLPIYKYGGKKCFVLKHSAPFVLE